jgi:hypothetical protein
MVLQLVIDEAGNYTYQDPRKKSINSEVQSQAFDAYEGNKNKDVVGETSLSTQTEKILRETPGQYTTTFDEETGQFKTKVTGQEDTEIDVKQPTVGEVVEQRETPLERVSKIASMTRPQPIDNTRVAQLIEDRNKLLARQQNLNFARDLAISFLPKKEIVKGIGGDIDISKFATPLRGPGGGFMEAGSIGGAAGAGAIAYGLSDAFKVKEKKGVTAGATIGMYAGGPVGAVVGAAVGGVVESVFGGTVICTELYKQNLMSKEDHRLSWNFTINNFSDTHINGYWYWAVPMVKLMKKNKLVTKFWNHIMSNRTKDIKWRLKKGKFNLLGRLYSMLIENGSYVIGKLICKKSKEVLV